MTQTPPNPNEAQDQSRLMLAIIISLAVLFGFNFFYETPKQEQVAEKAMLEVKVEAKAPVEVAVEAKSRSQVVGSSRRIKIAGDKIAGSISLTGARIDDLSLNDYYATINNIENVNLLSPSGTKDAYYFESGWTSSDSSMKLPNAKTRWSIARGSARKLKSGGSITLQWNNGQGLLFTRNIALDENYLFTVKQSITNKTNIEKKFNAWHLISRHNLPNDYSGYFILHEGPVSFLNDKLKELDYSDLADGDKLERENVRGWLGFTDKYWFSGILAEPHESFNARILGGKNNNKVVYQTDIVTDTYSILPGKTIEDKKFFYSGVKNLDLIKDYQEKYGFEKIDLTFDFGVLYIITKPFFLLLHFLIDLLGNVGLAIIGITCVIRGAMFPLASKSFRSMAAMKKVAPQLKELQTKYKDNREKLQMEIFTLYKKEKVNPFSGCWPLLIQIPIFFSLYKCILLSVELRHASFWGWVQDLSAPDPTNVFNLFGLIPFDPPAALTIGAWPILFCITMVIQKRLTPPMPDKTQEQLQTYFPYIITFMLAKFSVGLVIYWTWSNLLGLLQQYYIIKQIGGEDVCLVRGHADRRKKKKKKKSSTSKAKPANDVKKPKKKK